MTDRIRIAAEFPKSIVGHLERDSSGDWLVTSQGRWHVKVDSSVKLKQLKGWSGQWQRRRVKKGVVVVQPSEFERLLIEKSRGPEMTRTGPAFSSQGRRPAGEERRPTPRRSSRDPWPFELTAVGRQPDRRQQVRMIADLSRSDSVDDWVQLASCWAATDLRSEVKAAFGSIGWQRIESVLSASDAWSAHLWIVVRHHADLERRAAQAHRDRQLHNAIAEAPTQPPRYQPRVPETWLQAGWTTSEAASWFGARSSWIPPPELALEWWRTGLRKVPLIEQLNQDLTPAEFRMRFRGQDAAHRVAVDKFAHRLLLELHPSKPPATPERLAPAPAIAIRSGEVENSSPFQSWLDQSDWVIEQARLSSSLWRSFLATLFDESLVIANDGHEYLGLQPTQDWLDEVISKADNLRPLMRRVPVWPAIFESADLTVVAAEKSGVVAAWVGRGNEGLLLSFDTLTFRAWGASNHPSYRFAVGAAISWFVDLAIVPVRTCPPGLQDNGVKAAQGPRPAKEARRYVPLPSYHDHVDAVWRRGRTSPTAYRISGFRRRLPDGYEPSDWALSNAPAHIRAVMEADETFVRDHVRGGHEEMERLRMYLSKYSLLADTVGLARRR